MLLPLCSSSRKVYKRSYQIVRSIVYLEDFRVNSPIRKKNIIKGSHPASIVAMLAAVEAYNGFGLESAVQ